MGLVLGPLAETRLSLSMQAFGFSWMARPGVIAIALLLISGLVLSKGARASHPPADRVGPSAAPATERGELVFAAVLFAMLLAHLSRLADTRRRRPSFHVWPRP